MVNADSIGFLVQLKRQGRGAGHRKKKRNRLRRKSTRLVMTGRVELTPCVVCGSTRDLTIHHVEPIQTDRFVFLCKECHVLAHKPVFRTMEVCVAPGHFSIVPSAIQSRVDVPRVRGNGKCPVASSESGRDKGGNGECRLANGRVVRGRAVPPGTTGPLSHGKGVDRG